MIKVTLLADFPHLEHQEQVSDLLPPSYISIDVDVLDPSIAPGIGTPVPMGMTSQMLLYLLEVIVSQNKIVGIDVVELCPSLDQNDTTSSLIFHLLMYLLGLIHDSKNK